MEMIDYLLVIDVACRLLVRYGSSLFWMERLQLPWALKLQPPAYVCDVIGEEELPS
jgi:hypothetical protein